ncbi:MAG: hypothetical protein HY719_17285 [Planctomycetes bacterium]|nr:hypothetical protein [Planctomycetota bacterium]
MNGAQFLRQRDALGHEERRYYRNALFERFYGLVLDIAASPRFHISGRAALADELRQELALVLLAVLDSGSPDLPRGGSFAEYIAARLWKEARKVHTYACRGVSRREYETIDRERHRADRGGSPAPEPARALASFERDLSLDRLAAAPADVDDRDIDDCLDEVLPDFTPGERAFVSRAWGLSGPAEPMRDLVREFNVSRHRGYAVLREARSRVQRFLSGAARE